MFETSTDSARESSLFSSAQVIYHTTVRRLRQSHRSAVIGLVMTILQNLIMVAAFLLMFAILGVKSAPIRGDFVIFMLTGVFVYMTHVKAISAVASAEGPASPMMLHRPMNSIVAVTAASLAALYQQIVSLGAILLVYHIAINPVTIQEPIAALGLVILAWFCGVCTGLVFRALTPWSPTLVPMIQQLYIRVNMIASGKMFVVNTLPATMVAIFDWNPLFHLIDQLRGFVFLHYTPMVTSLMYPVYVSLALLVIGLMGEYFTNSKVSSSWSAGR